MSSLEDVFKPLIGEKTEKEPSGIQSDIVKYCTREPPSLRSSPVIVVNYLLDIPASSEIDRLKNECKSSFSVENADSIDYSSLPDGGYNLIVLCHGDDNDEKNSLEKQYYFQILLFWGIRILLTFFIQFISKPKWPKGRIRRKCFDYHKNYPNDIKSIE